MFKFTIDRQIWARGQREHITNKLLDFNPKTKQREQCCIGIFCTALGLPDAELKYNALASRVAPILPPEAQWLVDSNNMEEDGILWTDTSAAEVLYSCNDSPELDEPERERLIVENFAKHNVQVEFVN